MMATPGHGSPTAMMQVGGGSPTGAVPAPSGLSFGMPAAVPAGPYQAPGPRPQVRQGSFTPAPGHQPGPVPRGLSPSLAQLPMPARLGSMNNIPHQAYAPPALPARDPAYQNRSWQPLPVPVVGGLERPPLILDNSDPLGRSLTMLPADLAGNLAVNPGASPMADPRMPPGISTISGISNGTTATANSLASMPKQPSFNQGPVPINLNVYWHRPVAFDEQGRAQRNLGGNDLSWRQKFLKDVLGVYHVGIEVHGIEYTFGNYRAPSSRQVGGHGSGVFSHEPRRPGPHCVFKEGIVLGSTKAAPAQVEEICSSMANSEWSKASYHRIHHNCVDFCRAVSAKLGGGEIPSWCYRGADMAKNLGGMFGFGGPEPEGDYELSTSMDQSLVSGQGAPANGGSIGAPTNFVARPGPPPLGPPGTMPDPRQAAMEAATRAGTYVAPPPGPPPLPGLPQQGGTFVAPPMAGTYVAPPGPPPVQVPSLTKPPEVMGIQGIASANSALDPRQHQVMVPGGGRGRPLSNLPSFSAVAPGQPPMQAGLGGMHTMGGMVPLARPGGYGYAPHPGATAFPTMPARRDTLGATWRY